jgi:DNA-binding transcriptional LysR family regulator
MDLEKLRVFYQVAKHGSISAAAAKLKIAQSAISRSISMLEEELNTQLFIRPGGAKGVIPSDSGQLLLNSAKKIFELENLARIEVEDFNKEPAGTLKIITSLGTINFWLIEILPGFLKQHPKFNFILEGYNDVMIEFEGSDADVAIGPFVTNAPDLLQNYLMSYPLKLYASREYIKNFGLPKSVTELDNHRIIIFSTFRKSFLGNVDWHLNLGCAPGVSRKPFLQVNSSLALTKAAEQGLGIITMNPNFPGVEKLIEILPGLEGHSVDIYYSYHRNLKSSRRITAFQEYLKKNISAGGYYVEKSLITS